MRSEELAWKIRRHGIEMTHLSGGSHIGAVMSVADILAVLYTDVLKYDPKNPEWEERDRMILSKGHAGASIYAALAENGFFPVEELKTHYQDGSRLSGHVSHHLPGVDFSTGSLGHGLPVCVGIALAAKKDHRESRVYTVMGDGELAEGSVWEAAMAASNYSLDNLTAIVDHNDLQITGTTDSVMRSNPISNKYKAFGWDVVEVDGNDVGALVNILNKANNTGKPRLIVANTVKGKGITVAENRADWHHEIPTEEEYQEGLRELDAQMEALNND